MELTDLIQEVLKKSKVVRDGKIKIIKKTNKKGFKTQNGKEIKISAKERLARAKGQRKGAIKRKAKKSISNIKRNKSMKKRTFS